jgi:hypothetical protein
MAATDVIHGIVRNALVKDGWTITADPFLIKYDDVNLYADLGAERHLAAERGGRKIAVEIKSFLGPSPMRELETALGQYLIYRGFLELTASDRKVYLAITDTIYHDFFSREAIRVIIQRYDVSLLVVNPQQEEIAQWIG